MTGNEQLQISPPPNASRLAHLFWCEIEASDTSLGEGKPEDRGVSTPSSYSGGSNLCKAVLELPQDVRSKLLQVPSSVRYLLFSSLWKTVLWSSWTLIIFVPLAWGRWGRASLLYRWPLERKCWKGKPALVFVQFETGYQLVWGLYPQLAYSPLGFKNAYINIPQPLCLLQWKICWFVWTLKSQRQMFLSL